MSEDFKPIPADVSQRFFQDLERVLIGIADAIETLTDYLPASDPYAAAGYPLGKSWRGRRKWIKRYGRESYS